MTTDEGHVRNIQKRLQQVIPSDIEFTLVFTLIMNVKKGKYTEEYVYLLDIPKWFIQKSFKTRKALRLFCDKNIENFYTTGRRY